MSIHTSQPLIRFASGTFSQKQERSRDPAWPATHSRSWRRRSQSSCDYRLKTDTYLNGCQSLDEDNLPTSPGRSYPPSIPINSDPKTPDRASLALITKFLRISRIRTNMASQGLFETAKPLAIPPCVQISNSAKVRCTGTAETRAGGDQTSLSQPICRPTGLLTPSPSGPRDSRNSTEESTRLLQLLQLSRRIAIERTDPFILITSFPGLVLDSRVYDTVGEQHDIDDDFELHVYSIALSTTIKPNPYMHGRIAAQYSGDSVIGTLTSRLTNIAYGGYTYSSKVKIGNDLGHDRRKPGSGGQLIENLDIFALTSVKGLGNFGMTFLYRARPSEMENDVESPDGGRWVQSDKQLPCRHQRATVVASVYKETDAYLLAHPLRTACSP
ncbi:uncharacterized protein CLUP02_17996 [Colletotrichum lupini]|uniref:Uncharacterized protein n=1 Tax=Colletotrichum lupini TaxID=145971 RepID=A0A9Q8SG59_9PEZI|nr:uncharacterized protein CLUP02_17996 [Colletotrichum lupini]UQC76483.1 hypothetical protein CLUP02_17996 [Colletotrichum lupini]